jgi:hypothetical protein
VVSSQQQRALHEVDGALSLTAQRQVTFAITRS